MSNEIVTGTAMLTATEVLVAALTAWHPFVDVYVDSSADRVLTGSQWRVYAISNATRTIIAAGTFTGNPAEGQRILSAIPARGVTLELWAFSLNGNSAVPIRAALVGWDTGTFTANPDDSAGFAGALTPGPETLVGTIPWHPNVTIFVQGGTAAKGSQWRVKAVIGGGFVSEIPIAFDFFGDVQASRTVLETSGGAASWRAYASAPSGPTGALTSSLFGYATPGAGDIVPSANPGIIWKAGVPTGGDHVATYAEVEAFILAGGTSVGIDNSVAPCVVPGTANTQCAALVVFSGATPGASMTIADGGRLQNPAGFLQVDCICQATVRSPITCSIGNALLRVVGVGPGTGAAAAGTALRLLAGSTKAFVEFISNAFVNPSTLETSNGGTLDNSAVPGQALLTLDNNAVVNWVNIEQLSGPPVANTVSGGVFTNLNYTSDASAPFVAQPLYAGVVSLFPIDRAAGTSYNDALVAPPLGVSQVQAAIDVLKGLVPASGDNVFVTGLTTAGVGNGDFVYVSAAHVVSKTDADVAAKSQLFGASEGTGGSITIDGVIAAAKFTTAGGSPANGAPVWLAPATEEAGAAGKLTATAPTAAGRFVTEIGTCFDNGAYAGAKTAKVILQPKPRIAL